MSARAAWRLELMGFQRVYRYVAGKADWAASGHEVEGDMAHAAIAATRAQTEVPTCQPGDKIGEVHRRTRAAGRDFCIVVNQERVVLGRLRRKAWEAPAETPVEEVMEEGPTTLRPTEMLEDVTFEVTCVTGRQRRLVVRPS